MGPEKLSPAEVDPLLANDPSVSFVVPTYRRPEALRATLAALLLVDYPKDRYEIIVVDDGSGDDTSGVVLQLQAAGGPRLVYLRQENAGAATARNCGAQAATGELLIFVDDDILVAPDHVRCHLAARAMNGDLLVNGHWEFPPALRQALSGTPFGRFRLWVEDWVKEGMAKQPGDDGRETPAGVTACNLSISQELFWRLGGFDDTFPFAGCEDQDLSYRALLAGCRLVYDRRIRLIHNDQRLTLTQFCERQRRGSFTAVYLASRHPEEYAGRPLIVENGPLMRSDAPRTMVKKLVKRGLTWAPALATTLWIVAVMERVAPQSRLLQRAYWLVCGLNIFQGVRDGFAAVGAAKLVPVKETSACPS